MAPWGFDNGAQGVVPGAITSGQTTLVLQSSSMFAALAAGGIQEMLLIQDTGAGGVGVTKYEFVLATTNNTGTNTIGGLTRGQGGTSAQSFVAGATVTAVVTKEVLAGAFVRLDTALSQTLTGPLAVPTSLGGTPTATSYGSLPIKADQQAPSSGTSITIPASGTIPSWVRMVETEIIVRSGVAAGTDTLRLRYNGDTGANYNYCRSVLGAAYASTGAANAQTAGEVAVVAGATSAAGQTAVGTLRTIGPAATGLCRGYTYTSGRTDAGTLGCIPEISSGNWGTTNQAITTITLFLLTGPFVSGCSFVTYYYP